MYEIGPHLAQVLDKSLLAAVLIAVAICISRVMK